MDERELELRERLVEYQANVCCLHGILNDIESVLMICDWRELEERIRALIACGREAVAFGAGP